MMQWIPPFVGRALASKRAGIEATLFREEALSSLPCSITIGSHDFVADGPIPSRHTADGEGTSPALIWSGMPSDAKGMALLVEDADSPTSMPFVHLLAYGASYGDGECRTGVLDASTKDLPLKLGRNGMWRRRWMAPDPPRAHGSHRYVFQVYGLRQVPRLGTGASRARLAEFIRLHAVAKGAMVGTYERR